MDGDKHDEFGPVLEGTMLIGGNNDQRGKSNTTSGCCGIGRTATIGVAIFLILTAIAVVVILVFVVQDDPSSGPSPLPSYLNVTVSEEIVAAARKDRIIYSRLRELCYTFGHRLSGSQNLEDALDWIIAKMTEEGLDNVRKESVIVPKWVRGNESAFLVEPAMVAKEMNILGLGCSISTNGTAIRAPVVVVSSFEELATINATGKIVVYNQEYQGYGTTVQYRTNGAVEAAKRGAVASLTRSITPYSLQSPHTGGCSYAPPTPAIPTAAITVEDAEWFAYLQANGTTPVVELYMEAHTEPDAQSYNVIAELVGSDLPNEFVVIGGHTDSWDVGMGAQDDGGGVVSTWQALRLLKDLGIRPRRTIRAVGWTNEENGARGGAQYYADHIDEMNRTSVAIENDGGTFKPTMFRLSGSDEAMALAQAIEPLLEPLGMTVGSGGGGVDIAPMGAANVPLGSLQVDSTDYFIYHHTKADTPDKVSEQDLQEATAALAIIALAVADLDVLLPRT